MRRLRGTITVLLLTLGAPGCARAHAAAQTRAPVAVPEPSDRARSYQRGNTVLWLADLALGVAIPAAVLATGLAARLRDAAARTAARLPWTRGRRWATVAGVVAGYGLLATLAMLPFAFYAGFVREHAYGLSTQTLGKWLRDGAIAWTLATGFAMLAAPVVFLLLRRSPRRWWLWATLAAAPVLVALQIAGPVWVAPLFDRFRPLEAGPLRDGLVALATRAGVGHADIFVVDASADTRALNAYVAGLGGTHRIVLWDTLLERLSHAEVRAVTAHELGHYVLGHVRLGLGLALAGLMATLWLVHRTAGWAIGRWRARFGFDTLADPAALPLLLLLATLASLPLTPAALALSRRLERDADRYALELTRDPRAVATSFVALQETNLADPRPPAWLELLRYSHPPLGDRIDAANGWRPAAGAGR